MPDDEVALIRSAVVALAGAVAELAGVIQMDVLQAGSSNMALLTAAREANNIGKDIAGRL